MQESSTHDLYVEALLRLEVLNNYFKSLESLEPLWVGSSGYVSVNVLTLLRLNVLALSPLTFGPSELFAVTQSRIESEG